MSMQQNCVVVAMSKSETNTNFMAVLWDEYQTSAEEAREALRMGDKLKALTLAIWSNQVREEYMNKLFWAVRGDRR